MRPCFALIPACVALATLTRCAPVHDATPANCPAGQQPSGSTCVCLSTQAPPVDGSCDTTPGDGGTCSVDDCEDDGNPCTDPTCLEGAEICSNEPVADTTVCEMDGSQGTCVSGVCTVPEPKWELGVPFRIGGEGGEIVRPRVTVDATGNAIAVWAEADALMACHFESGEGWGEPTVIDEAFEPSRAFAIDSDAEGNAVTVYARVEQGSIDIRAARYDSVLQIWSTPDVMSRDASVASDPGVAISSDGKVVAVWWEAPNDVMLTRTATDRLTWDAPVVISPSDGFEKGAPYLSLADTGYGAVIYRGYQSPGAGAETIWVNTLTSDGPISDPEAVDVSASQIQSVRIATADSDQLMAVWQQDDDIWQSHFSLGQWSSAKLLETTPDPAYSQEVIHLGSEAFLAAWSEQGRLRARRFDTAEGWSETVLLHAPGRRPSLVSGSGGEAWIAFWDGRFIGLEHFTPELGWGAFEKISLELEPNAPVPHRPDLGRGQDGTLVAVWADGTDVWAWTDQR